MTIDPTPTRRQLEVLRLLALGVKRPLGRSINNPSGYKMMDTMRERGWTKGYPATLTDKGVEILAADDKRRRK